MLVACEIRIHSKANPHRFAGLGRIVQSFIAVPRAGETVVFSIPGKIDSIHLTVEQVRYTAADALTPLVELLCTDVNTDDIERVHTLIDMIRHFRR